MSDIPTKARQIVKERSNGQCSRCGALGYQIHHRLRRREGGHALGILVLLCSTCHKWAHGHPNEAKATGFIISVHDREPEAVPIKTFMGWMLFDNDGGATFVEGEAVP
jgi:hypothetical protein